ncbi:anthranilate synthase component II [Aeoliella mucimassa]|uniref:Aminodeoxychorismate/anthranilate synthase component 2 n=1 Tax=Aeoliella mucimassa TaxID=2527972 RepID=A0A518AK71_9BACT|nr:aminodeoxychorismate/anthranilate synthase component II [Aeoliella mucimassa]QDU55132.1 Aminodeoxychorismate/anthranilate synthase component 2 [Aeoliella mucimassa]
MILIIDNYDSFVHNLARYIERLGGQTRVVRNDQITIDEVRKLDPQAVVLSPGPCTPDQAGCSLELVRELHLSVPMLGVCLGHQTIAQALGASILRDEQPYHGRSSAIRHTSEGVFAGVPSPVTVGRYHSLVVDPVTLPDCLLPTAWTTEGDTLMAFAHRELPLVGVQFHPESILTEYGYTMLANFLQLAGVQIACDFASLGKSELREPVEPRPMPGRPVTF